MTDAVLMDGVSKHYPKTWRREAKSAVIDLSLTIRQGEAFGFVGPNGAGKSTTIKMLLGALRPSQGRIEIFGRDANDPQSRLGLGYVPENPCLSDYLTPLEILGMALAFHRVDLSDHRAHCMAWLERFGLADVAGRVIRTFSKGMTQRVALAHAMVIRPRFLVLDEPLSGLDPVGRREVLDILTEYLRDGGSLFFSSHVLYDVERLADRFGLIHQGRLVTVRSPGELAAHLADRYVILYQAEQQIEEAKMIRSGLYEVEAGEDELAMRVAEVLRAGGRIKEVRPRTSLERVFFDLVRPAHSQDAE